MRSLMLKLALLTSLMFAGSSAFAKTITGKQCKAALAPVQMMLFNESYSPIASWINERMTNLTDEKGKQTNVRGATLTQLANYKGADQTTKSFSNITSGIVKNCKSTCHGVTVNHPTNGKLKFDCGLIGVTTPNQINEHLNLIDEKSTAEVAEEKEEKVSVFTPDARCAFDKDRPECKKPEVKEETKEEVVIILPEKEEKAEPKKEEPARAFADTEKEKSLREIYIEASMRARLNRKPLRSSESAF